MPPIKLLLLQLLVVVVAIALRHPLTAVPIFAVTLLPPFFFCSARERRAYRPGDKASKPANSVTGIIPAAGMEAAGR